MDRGGSADAAGQYQSDASQPGLFVLRKVSIVLASFLALPLPLIVLICVLVPVLVVTPIVLKVSNYHVTADSDAGYEGLVALFGFVGTAFALLLAFIIVNVQTEQTAAQSTLFSETSTMETMLKEVKAFDPKLTPEIKGLVLDYLELMRTDEIDVRPPAGGDPRAEAAFEKILARMDKLERDTPGGEAQAVLDEAEKLAGIRDERVDTPAGTLDETTTLICVVLALITAIVMALLPAPRRWVRWVQSLGVAAAVGLVLSLVFYIASDAYTESPEGQQIKRVEQVKV